MKKAVIILVVILITGLTVKAQVLIGGSLGIDYKKEKVGHNYKSSSNFVFSILPKVGFYLNDKFALGVETGIIRSVTKYSTSYNNNKTVETAWKIAAFARYHIVTVNNFVFLLEGNLGFVGSKTAPKEWLLNQKEKVNIFSITVQPVLAYQITKKVSIEASCDFLQFGFLRSSYKLNEIKYSNNHVGLGLNSDIDNSISNALKVGMIFKF